MSRKISYYEKKRMPQMNLDFISKAASIITQMNNECRPKTVYNCQTALRALQRYLDCCRTELRKRLTLRCFSPDLISGFCRHLAGHGVTENTVREYLRSLRSIVNRCIRLGLPLRSDLFSQVRTSTLSSAKQPLSEDDMRRLHAVPLKVGSKDEKARDMAVFSYLTGGIPFADLARLQTSSYNPQTNCLTYRRHKTGVAVRVCLTPEARRIWHRYSCVKAGSPYHFGWIASLEPAEAERECLNALACYNRSLKRLTARSGVTVEVTSYTLRHTYASVAHNNYNAAVNVISATLGHRSERTTAIYISQVDCGQVFTLQMKMERGLLK